MENVQTINDSDMSDSVKKETITTVNILFFPLYHHDRTANPIQIK